MTFAALHFNLIKLSHREQKKKPLCEGGLLLKRDDATILDEIGILRMIQFSLCTVKSKVYAEKKYFKTIGIEKFSDLARYITIPDVSWMPSVLKNDGYRKIDNFSFNQLMVLDYDDNDPKLDEMVQKMNRLGYMHIIGTTENHNKTKSGKFAERFRLVLPLNRPMPDSAERYKWVMENMIFRWGKADDQAINKTRMFKPCDQIISMKDGRLFDYEEPPSDEQIAEIKRKRFAMKYPKQYVSNARLPNGLKDRIRRPIPEGERACSCYEIAFALGQYNYSHDETVSIVAGIPKDFGDGFDHKEMMRNITNGWEGK